MQILTLLHEADVIDSRKSVDQQQPLKRGQTIRVYHATDDPSTLVEFLTQGVSGDRAVPRKYSYETVNNPKGLFVTIDFKRAKEFGPYIIEFHTKMSDLEAPVWKGGAYTVQGGYSQQYGSDTERSEDQQELQRSQEKSPHRAISQSDQPDVASRLMNFSENQALFIGNLDPTSIRAVWISSNPKRIGQDYMRLTRKQAIAKFEKHGIPTRYGDEPTSIKSMKLDKHRQKIFKPRETATYQELVKRLAAKHKFTDAAKVDKIFTDKDILQRYARDLTWSDEQLNNIIKTHPMPN